MSSFIPITLVGSNLGKRHQYLNSLVNKVCQQNIPFQSVQDVPEQSAVDRLFKIDLANKQKNVVYIIRNLKDDDMLYVSRALKCLWLLESQYSNIINPTYLEDVLFPEMTATAVNKMKHWLQSHLKDTQRCEQFYMYYTKRNDFNSAVKFLLHCSADFVLKEAKPDIFVKLNPTSLKILCEKCPTVAKLYFESFDVSQSVLSKYLENDKEYYNKLRFLLKHDADMFLDITEKYFNKNGYQSFSAEATKYIMKNHKNRFNRKSELYTAWLLDINTVGKHLSSEEIKDVVVKLARAEYLSSWFSYKKVEPLLKCLNVEDRTAFKKKVFVEKSFGEKIKEWSYPIPSRPRKVETEQHVFLDLDAEPYYAYEMTGFHAGGVLSKYQCLMDMSRCIVLPKPKTLLDKLFDEYRFASFEHTLFMLRKQMAAESSAQNRQYIMLVLVSKSGGRAEALETLLRLLVERHGNEPATLRAAVVRSLVRRAGAWRLPPAAWDLLLRVGRDLGLDGAPPAAACREGLHAVVLRNILQDVEIEPSVWKAFLNEFSSLDEYPLTAAERRCVRERLPALLLAAAESEPDAALVRLDMLLDALDAYRLRATDRPGAVRAVAAAARRDPAAARPLLRRLYDARVARRDLFRENFAFLRGDASHVNALRHDAEAIDAGGPFGAAAGEREWRHERYERFLRKVRLYFGEQGGLAARLLSALDRATAETPHVALARPLALLAGGSLAARLRAADAAAAGGEAEASRGRGRLAGALRANAHAARPPLDVDAFGWRAAGAKAVANAVCVCRAGSLRRRVRELLAWRRTARLALALALRARDEAPTFAAAAALRPSAALKAGLRHLRRRGDDADPRVWDAVKPLVWKLDLSLTSRERLRRTLADVASMPRSLRPDYCFVVYEALRKSSKKDAHKMLSKIESLLPELNDEFLTDVTTDFLQNELTLKNVEDGNHNFKRNAHTVVRMTGKSLLLCTGVTTREIRLKFFRESFTERIESLRKSSSNEFAFQLLETFVGSLKYNTAFFDERYVGSLPVFEVIITWMHKMLPVEMHFSLFATMHLTMLYYKSIKQSAKQLPDVFADKSRKESEGVEIVGTVFGKYIAHELGELMARYFPSIREMYQEAVMCYLGEHFNRGKSHNKFLTWIVKGFLEESSDREAQLLAEYIYKEELMHSPDTCEDLLNDLKNIGSKEMRVFLCADVLLA